MPRNNRRTHKDDEDILVIEEPDLANIEDTSVENIEEVVEKELAKEDIVKPIVVSNEKKTKKKAQSLNDFLF